MLISREFSFAAAHRLPGSSGSCERLHGHTWRLRVTVQAPVGQDGIAFDFRELKRVVEERVLKQLDHTYWNALVAQPSAERIAQWAWKQLANLPLYEIRVWESNDTFVTYRGEAEKST